MGWNILDRVAGQVRSGQLETIEPRARDNGIGTLEEMNLINYSTTASDFAGKLTQLVDR